MQTRQVASRLADSMSRARELINWAKQELQNSSKDPALDALILLSEVTELSRTQVLLRDHISEEEESRFTQFIERRKQGEPIQYITGRAYFRNLTVQVGPGVLIPRPESESLISGVKAKIENEPNPLVLDLGSGSGVLALAVATELPKARVVALERDSRAIYWLHKNISALNAKVEVIESDVSDFEGHGEFDVVIANPPYIPIGEKLPEEVNRFEPHVALFGGESGLEVPKLFVEAAARALKPGGYLALEHHERQEEQVGELLSEFFNEVALHYDLNGRPRWSSGVRS